MEFSEKAHTSQTIVLLMVLDVKMLAFVTNKCLVHNDKHPQQQLHLILVQGARLLFCMCILWHIKTTLNTAVVMG